MPQPSNSFGSIDDLLKPKTPEAPTDQLNYDHKKYDPLADESASRSEKAKASLAEKMEEFNLETQEKNVSDKALILGFPYIDLTAFPIGPEILAEIPETEARTHQILPFFRLENQIRLACVDPDEPAIHDIVNRLQQEHEGAHIKIYLISKHSFENAAKLYKNVAKVKKVEYGVKITAEKLQQYQTEITSYKLLQQKILKANMTEAFAMIISLSMNMRSSDVHIEAEEIEALIRFRIDGVLKEVARFPLNILQHLVNRIKIIAGLKINVNDVPQDGRIVIKMGVLADGSEDELDLRVSTLPSAYGESVVFRLLRSSSVGFSFEQLGMRTRTLEILKTEMAKPNGMIITTGPTGSGKTTTLYAILNKLNNSENKIITLENPIEYKLKGIVQSQIDHARGYTFVKGLRSILRQDPDIVMVGEIRDRETAQTAIDAALTGHLMLSTIHTNDASGVIPRFLGMGINGIFLAPALNAVIGQRLVRRLWKNCQQEYNPQHEQLTKVNEWLAKIPENAGEKKIDPSQIKWYKSTGCSKCDNSGYQGRVGIYEAFTVGSKIEAQILSGKVSEFQMKDILHDAGMLTMGQDGILKAAEGLTTLDEVFRVAKE